MNDDNEEIKKQLESLTDLINVVQSIKHLSKSAGDLYSTCLVLDIDKVERTLLDSFNSGSAALNTISEHEKKKLYDKAALLGCLSRFKKDLEDNTQIARDTKQRYETLLLNK